MEMKWKQYRTKKKTNNPELKMSVLFPVRNIMQRYSNKQPLTVQLDSRLKVRFVRRGLIFFFFLKKTLRNKMPFWHDLPVFSSCTRSHMTTLPPVWFALVHCGISNCIKNLFGWIGFIKQPLRMQSKKVSVCSRGILAECAIVRNYTK